MWFEDFLKFLHENGDDTFYQANYFAKVDSTNEVVKRAYTRHEIILGAGGVPSAQDTLRAGTKIVPEEGFLVVGEEQTAGKGRQGRSWASPSGESVYFSMLLTPKFRPEHASAITLVMGLSVAQAVRRYPGPDVRIKWPNDIVINGKKICGILTEAQASQTGLDYVVPGTGINVNNREFPEELRDRATSLRIEAGEQIPRMPAQAETGSGKTMSGSAQGQVKAGSGKTMSGLTGDPEVVSRARVLAETLHAFRNNYVVFSETGDMAGLIGAYNDLLIDINEKIRVEDPAGPYVATSRGIDNFGRLIVEKEDGTEVRVATGEVSVRGIYGYV